VPYASAANATILADIHVDPRDDKTVDRLAHAAPSQLPMQHETIRTGSSAQHPRQLIDRWYHQGDGGIPSDVERPDAGLQAKRVDAWMGQVQALSTHRYVLEHEPTGAVGPGAS
jgi:hypothetical protein